MPTHPEYFYIKYAIDPDFLDKLETLTQEQEKIGTLSIDGIKKKALGLIEKALEKFAGNRVILPGTCCNHLVLIPPIIEALTKHIPRYWEYYAADQLKRALPPITEVEFYTHNEKGTELLSDAIKFFHSIPVVTIVVNVADNTTIKVENITLHIDEAFVEEQEFKVRYTIEGRQYEDTFRCAHNIRSNWGRIVNSIVKQIIRERYM